MHIPCNYINPRKTVFYALIIGNQKALGYQHDTKMTFSPHTKNGDKASLSPFLTIHGAEGETRTLTPCGTGT